MQGFIVQGRSGCRCLPLAMRLKMERDAPFEWLCTACTEAAAG